MLENRSSLATWHGVYASIYGTIQKLNQSMLTKSLQWREKKKRKSEENSPPKYHYNFRVLR